MPKRPRTESAYSSDNGAHLHTYLLDTSVPQWKKRVFLQQCIETDERYINVAYFSMVVSIGMASRGESGGTLVTVVAPVCPAPLLQDALDYFCTVPLADRARYTRFVAELRRFVRP
jgi:hypothetical protein